MMQDHAGPATPTTGPLHPEAVPTTTVTDRHVDDIVNNGGLDRVMGNGIHGAVVNTNHVDGTDDSNGVPSVSFLPLHYNNNSTTGMDDNNNNNNNISFGFQRTLVCCGTIYRALVDLALLVTVLVMSFFFYDVEIRVVKTQSSTGPTTPILPQESMTRPSFWTGSRVVLQRGTRNEEESVLHRDGRAATPAAAAASVLATHGSVV